MFMFMFFIYFLIIDLYTSPSDEISIYKKIEYKDDKISIAFCGTYTKFSFYFNYYKCIR